MSVILFKYFVTFLFVAATFYLSYLGMKKTECIRSFSIGKKDMNPIIVGITMAASISSTATFVINPGFIYNHGLSAYLHYGVAALLGIIAAFLCLTRGFRKLGETNGSLTIPNWIYHRYGSRALSIYFAVINLLSLTFVVLILVGSSILLSSLFPISQKASLITVLLFVFSYVLMGGTYAHAYTNSLQGIMMIGIALVLFFFGVKYWNYESIEVLKNVSTHYMSVVNPESPLYYDYFSVFTSGFIITFALMLQPHILTKVLYLKGEGDVNKFLITVFVVGAIFSMMLLIGFYARLEGLSIGRQDEVVSQYITHILGETGFGPYILVFITLTMLAAGMSTLDGILVSLSAMVVNDLYMPLSKERSEADALKISRYVLVLMGLIAFVIAWNPPKLVGIFAQKGVYGLAASSLVPILFGTLIRDKVDNAIIWTGAILGLGVHLILNLSGMVLNPSVSSSYAILIALGTSSLMYRVQLLMAKNSTSN